MDEEVQEKENEEKEQARMSGIVIMNIDFKTDIVVKESIQNRLKSMLFWVTPYVGPAHNRIYNNNEHPRIINSLCVRIRPKL